MRPRQFKFSCFCIYCEVVTIHQQRDYFKSFFFPDELPGNSNFNFTCLKGLKMINELSKHVVAQLVRYNVRNSSIDGDLFTDHIKLRNVPKEV